MNMKPILITIGVCGVLSTLLALIGGWPLVCFFWLVAITGAATLYPAIEVDAAAIDGVAPETDDIIGEGLPPSPIGGMKDQPAAAATTTIAMPNGIEAYRLRSISMSTYDRHGRIVGPSSMISVPLIGVVG